MAKRRKPRGREAQLAFEGISIEGGLLSPEWLSKIAQLSADRQGESDYRVPKGLNLRDEIGRYWRIAQAHWSEFSVGLKASADRQALAVRFITSLFRECFGFTSLAAVAPVILEDRTFPLGHAALSGRVPVVVAPAASGIDTLAHEFGDDNRRRSAFGLAQEYLNAAQDAVWGIATDGTTIRIVRDNASLTRPAWIEVDLGRIFAEELYADFAALWLLSHETRFGGESLPSTDCALEAWRAAGRDEGTRAREHLRRGVEETLAALGQGFLSHGDNQSLRAALADGSLTTRDYFGQLLRLVYRLIFLLTVEERNLLHPDGTSETVRSLYLRGYSLRRLCERSVKRSAHDRFGDLWETLKVVLRGLSDGEPRLGLPALAGIFDSKHCLALDAARLENRSLLLALYKLAWLRDEGALARVNWRDMGSEELGSVYEGLLELFPQITEQGRKFGFVTAAGNERKTSGSYYTPSSLVECLLDSALDPVISQRLAGKVGTDAEKAILALRVCDPACGSGHFLIAAAHRLARRLAATRANTQQPTLQQLRHALREVISHCLYGVDLNPMAVELCKVTLWLEAMEPGKPLGFLEHHIQCGNSLLGATPRALEDGIPDDAFKPLTGDDPDFCKAAKKLNKEERSQLQLFHGSETQPWERLGNLPAAIVELEAMSDETASALHHKEKRYAELVRDASYRNARFLTDAWCAAFVWRKCEQADGGFDYAITNDVLRNIERNPHDCAPWMREEIQRLSDRYQFFHWHLAFPEVFSVPKKGERPANTQAGWNGGFDVMLGNPPWERVKLQEKEWFAEKLPEIANAPNAAARKRLIQQLREQSPEIFAAFADDVRKAEGEAQVMRTDELYPLCGCGDMNTYALFAERTYRLVSQSGIFGLVLPTGLVTGDNTKAFFGELMRTGRLRAFIGFDNEEKQIFPDIDNNLTFAAVVVGPDSGTKPKFCFNIRRFEQLKESERFFELSDDDLSLLNPNTRTCPIFRSSADGDLVRQIYKHLPLMWREVHPEANTWGIRFMTMFHMAGDSEAFVSEAQLISKGATRTRNRFVLGEELFYPLYEAKMIWHFEHRWAAFFGCEMFDGRPSRKYVGWYGVRYEQPDDLAFGRYWVSATAIRHRIGPDIRYFAAFRDITNRDLERTMVFTILPTVAVGHQAPMVFLPGKAATELACFVAERNSIAADFVARNKIDGSHLTYFVFKQLPTLAPEIYARPCGWASETLRDWLLPRALELTYTAWDLEHFAHDCGWFGPPFAWDEARRFQLRCEIDAAFFHLYGLSRDDAAYILDTFPIVRRKDEEKWGEYRTKRVILEIYDALRDSAQTRTEYRTVINPIPASFRCMHAPRLPDDKRVALDSAPKFLLSFVCAFLRQTGKEASFDLLDSLFHLLRHRAGHADEFASVLGDGAKRWLSTFNDLLPNKEFVPFLKRLEADGWIKVNRATGELRMTEKFPDVPFDAWRNFDVSAALRVLANKPELVQFILTDSSASLASREFTSQKVG